MYNPYAGKFRVTQSWDAHIANDGPAGVDYGMDEWTPLYAPCDGILHFFWNGTAGWDAVVFRPDGSSERQCHNVENDLAHSLHMTAVKQGQHISYSGNTGTSTGPHVHCNGWTVRGVRVPPFGGIMTAGLELEPITDTEEADMAMTINRIRNVDNGSIAFACVGGGLFWELPHPDYEKLLDGWGLWDRRFDQNVPGNIYLFLKNAAISARGDAQGGGAFDWAKLTEILDGALGDDFEALKAQIAELEQPDVDEEWLATQVHAALKGDLEEILAAIAQVDENTLATLGLKRV